ncbi:hypothetical protein LSH36_61g12000 [Paralvinella palmiformis]|uniref:Uncharacterized protein n=1 Tax=Paralvinella palmiformis TaxID=53620 RepID=A0AAD9K4Z1_9ANNE|nr:hypothetical protein LSH36_61g12000 [Paralvinella palmiformis]
MLSSSLVVPMVMWGRNAPTHCICSILLTPDEKHIVTGSNDGQICVWDMAADWKVNPHQMLIGHNAAVTSLVLGSISQDKPYIVSSSDNGEMCLWDLRDGCCIESTKSTVVHTSIQPNQAIYEDESKQIRCLNAQTLKCCAYNQRTVLIVCSKYWQIYDTTWVMGKPSSGQSQAQLKMSSSPKGVYDAGDFSLLCSESSRRGERWCGGEFISIDRIVVWSTEGKGYLFKLPTNISDNEDYHKPGNPSSPRQVGPQAYTVLDVYMEKSLECSPSMIYFFGRRDREKKLILRGDSDGRVVVWSIPDVHDSKMKLVRQESFEKLPVVLPKCCTSLQEAWDRCTPATEGVIDQLNHTEERQLQITSSIYIPTQGRLVCGRDDGSIVITPATVSIVLQLLENGQMKGS